MRLIFLGTGGYHPNERRQTACLMLPEIGVVFDAGTGFFRVAPRLATDELQIFLTHAHLDHVVGLTYLLAPLMTGQLKRVRVYGSRDCLGAVRTHLFAEALFPVLPGAEFVELPAQVALPGGGELTHCRLVHPGGSLGFRVDWPDRSLAYITDTTVDGTYTEFVRGVTVLVHECYFPDAHADWAVKTGHSHTTQVARLARDAQVGKLMLTHVDPLRPEGDPIGLADARNIFPATDIATDLAEIEF